MKNIIYYEDVMHLGGTTTYEIELCKKYYKTKDITLYYKTGSSQQIARLKRYVRCVKWNGEDVDCDVFITNYDFQSFINHVHFKFGIQVIHADFDVQRKFKPRLDDRFDIYLCVSELVRKKFQLVSGLPNEKLAVCHNPLTVEENELKPPLIIGSFTRLSEEKGGKRMKELIYKLDSSGINYIWYIFTNDDVNIKSENIVVKKPLIYNARNYMSMCDLVAQLSDCEGDNYTTKEAKSVGCKLILTPCESFEENGLLDDCILLDFDLSNIDEVVGKIKNEYINKPSRKLSYVPLKDDYDKYLLDGKSGYEGENVMVIKVLKDFDISGTKIHKVEGEVFATDDIFTEERAMNAIKAGYAVEVVETANQIAHTDEVIVGKTKTKRKYTKKEK